MQTSLAAIIFHDAHTSVFNKYTHVLIEVRAQLRSEGWRQEVERQSALTRKMS